MLKLIQNINHVRSLVSNISQSASSQFYNLWLSDVLDVLFSPSLPMINVAVKMLLVFVVFNVIEHFLSCIARFQSSVSYTVLNRVLFENYTRSVKLDQCCC